MLELETAKGGLAVGEVIAHSGLQNDLHSDRLQAGGCARLIPQTRCWSPAH
jgi:hypothetical protein